MKNPTILDRLDDPEILSRLGTRRDALRGVGRLGLTLSVPVALATMAKSAFAATLPQAVVDVLNFALTLEYLESEFYNVATRASGLIPATVRDVFLQIRLHENAHVEYLQHALGKRAVAKPMFDFTAGGQFDPFHDYPTFLILSQGFEDTGVRAYAGQLAALQPYDAVLTAAARIHSVEARHAAEVRRIRGEKGWISFNDPTAPAALAATYAGEANLTQLGVDVSAFEGAEAGTEAFDEPLTKAAVLAIAGLFIK